MNDNFENRDKKTGQTSRKLLYFFTIFILILVLFAAFIFSYIHPAGTKVKSEVSGFSEAALDGAYFLVNESGAETRLPTAELLYQGNYYKNRITGEVYFVIYDESECKKVNGIGINSLKLKKINNIEGDNFSTYQKDGRYARDAKKVYFTDLPEQEMGCNYDLLLKIVDGVDPDTFEPRIESYFDLSPGNYYRGIYSRDSRDKGTLPFFLTVPTSIRGRYPFS